MIIAETVITGHLKTISQRLEMFFGGGFMVFNDTFNNISVISWRSVFRARVFSRIVVIIHVCQNVILHKLNVLRDIILVLIQLVVTT